MKLTKGYKTVTNIKQITEVYFYLNSSGKLLPKKLEGSDQKTLLASIQKQLIFLPENKMQEHKTLF